MLGTKRFQNTLLSVYKNNVFLFFSWSIIVEIFYINLIWTANLFKMGITV
jgi:hypothetical protein